MTYLWRHYSLLGTIALDLTVLPVRDINDKRRVNLPLESSVPSPEAPSPLLCCSVLRCVAACEAAAVVLHCQCIAACYSVAVCCSVLQLANRSSGTVSVRCIVMQCVAVCRSVLRLARGLVYSQNLSSIFFLDSQLKSEPTFENV